jgi:hypothetical protein
MAFILVSNANRMAGFAAFACPCLRSAQLHHRDNGGIKVWMGIGFLSVAKKFKYSAAIRNGLHANASSKRQGFWPRSALTCHKGTITCSLLCWAASLQAIFQRIRAHAARHD